ncbi:hypothetical protein TSAR_012594 [Trichomalopsis sarcophagae]|uniref:Uncharacterized protein n=1 Tax=Trichomalopsis sarcophagae TaxID=543379 RepID=A0A232EEJ0_9HYME|nr:hypothetical protein TSAR_012594 [Trichomalopsis sarcophagae]
MTRKVIKLEEAYECPSYNKLPYCARQRTCSTESTVLFHKSKDSQTSTNATKYRCHQILPTVFGLNNSYGKIVHIGLENTSVGSDDFNPIVRLSNNEFYGLCLPLASWLQFRELFDEIDRYFQAYSEDDMLDQRITFSKFYIRFMISYSNRAFELLEDYETKIRKDSGESRSKKVRKPSLVFKTVTFDRLKALSKIIDHRIKYLLKVKEVITIIVKELGDYIKDKLVNSENAKFTYFTSYNRSRRAVVHIIHQSFVDRRGVNTLTSKLLHRSPKCHEKSAK